MEPVILILTALISGANTLARGRIEDLGEAYVEVKNTYENLTSMLSESVARRHIKRNITQPVLVVNRYERNPRVWSRNVGSALYEVAAHRNEEVVSAANQLIHVMSRMRGDLIVPPPPPPPPEEE